MKITLLRQRFIELGHLVLSFRHESVMHRISLEYWIIKGMQDRYVLSSSAFYFIIHEKREHVKQLGFLEPHLP